MDAKVRKAILARYQERYSGFGPTFAVEKLEADGYQLDHETLRRWLIQEGLWQKRRQRKQHRAWRERKEHFGELVQLDGSPHKWFGGEGGEFCLLDMVDDATGITFALFDEEETIRVAMLTLWGWIKRYGIPRALYVDKKNVYVTPRAATRAEQLRGERPLTHFGKACKKLGIQIVPARSPQAKGRVERKNGVHQDRLVKELQLENIKDKDQANQFLVDTYLDGINKRFQVTAKSSVDFHRPVPEGLDLRTVFCLEEERQVNNDWTVRYQNQFFQITKANKILPRRGEKIMISEWLDDSLHMMYKGAELKYQELPAPPSKPVAEKVTKRQPPKKYIPPADHPWRKFRLAKREKN